MFSNSALTVGMHEPVKNVFPFHFQSHFLWFGRSYRSWDWLNFLIVAAHVMPHLLYTAFNNPCKHEHSKLQDISQWVQLCLCDATRRTTPTGYLVALDLLWLQSNLELKTETETETANANP